MLKWLKSKGCHCDEWTFASAAIEGDIERMIWLKRNGCPWNESMFYYATDNRGHEALEWLKINGCPMPNWIRAKESLKYETTVQWFHTNGYRVQEGLGFLKIQE